MTSGLLAALVVVAAVLFGVLGLLLVDRARLRRRVQTSEAAFEALDERVHALSEELESARLTAAATPARSQEEYVITTAGVPARTEAAAAVPDRAVLSATVGEPLVKVFAFGYGVRRALAPETRNRIAFEMRREVKRARKERRRAAKDALRETKRQEAA